MLYSIVKGKNPFKDIRVRKALYQAVDEETLKRTVMRGQSLPTGANTPSPLGTYNDAQLEKRLLPYDPIAAMKLLAEAGYPNGFEFEWTTSQNESWGLPIVSAVIPLLDMVGI